MITTRTTKCGPWYALLRNTDCAHGLSNHLGLSCLLGCTIVVQTVFGRLTLLGIDCQVAQLLSAIEVSVAMLFFSRALGELDNLAGLYLAFVFFLMLV